MMSPLRSRRVRIGVRKRHKRCPGDFPAAGRAAYRMTSPRSADSSASRSGYPKVTGTTSELPHFGQPKNALAAI